MPRRRTRAEYDAERSAKTRAALLDVTFEALVELGYAKTTTVEVVRRAGVSRGTLLHHFPNRHSLILASLERVFELRIEAFEEQATALTHGAERSLSLEEAVELLWRAIGHSDASLAWVELVVAARSEERLREPLLEVMRAFDKRIEEAQERWFGSELLTRGEYPRRLMFAMMNGLVLEEMAGLHESEGAVAFLKLLAGRVSGMLDAGRRPSD